MRRNRFVLGIVYQTVRVLFRYLFKRKFLPVDDHMIWAYQAKLDPLAKTRGHVA